MNDDVGSDQRAGILSRIAGRLGKPALVCVPLVGPSADAVLGEVDRVVPKSPDLVEWRVDHFARLHDASHVMETLREIRRRARGVPLLFTRRSVQEGGQSVSIDDAQIASLYGTVCAARLVDLVDIEMDTQPQFLKSMLSAAHASGVATVLSWHDFSRTLAVDDLVSRFRRAQELGGDVAKVAVMPQTEDDVLALLAATLQSSRSLSVPVIGISMGVLGVVSRIAGWRFGSSVTFAAGDASSAPGQPGIAELRTAMDVLTGDVR